MTTMTHAGYSAVVEWDEDAQLFHGEVTNIRGVLTFQGTTTGELVLAFAETVADYLDWCRERRMPPSAALSEANQAGNSDRY